MNIIVPSDLLDSGTFGAHDRAMEFLGYGTLYGHLGFLGEEGTARRKTKAKVKVNHLWLIPVYTTFLCSHFGSADTPFSRWTNQSRAHLTMG